MQFTPLCLQHSHRPFLRVLVVAAGMLLPASSFAAAETWRPDRPIEVVVGAGAGGSLDVTARTLQKIMQEKKLSIMPVNVLNRSGGGGLVAANYLLQKPADGHTVMVSAPPLLANTILGRAKFNFQDLTPVALLYSQYIVFAVKPDSRFKSAADLAAELKADSSAVVFGFGGVRGNLNHVATAEIARAVGGDPSKLKIVVFPSASDANTALLGGHIDVVAAGASIVLPHHAAGTVRSVGVTAPARLAGGPFASVPTWKEAGIDVVIDNWVGLVGHNRLAPEHVAYWDDVLEATVRSAEWKKALAMQSWQSNYLNSDKAKSFMQSEYDQLKKRLAGLGMLTEVSGARGGS